MIALALAGALVFAAAGFLVWIRIQVSRIELDSGPGTSESLAGVSREGERGPGWAAYEDEGPGS